MPPAHDTALVWFRRDLRLADNPSLARALDAARAVVPVATEPPAYAPGAAASSWRSASLAALDADLRARGSRLAVCASPAPEELAALAHETRATALFCTRAWDDASVAEETGVRAALADAGVEVLVTESAYLAPPATLATGEGRAYRVFTPFFRAWEREVGAAGPPLPAPERIPTPAAATRAAEGTLDGAATPASAVGVLEGWTPGERGAHARLDAFVSEALASYGDARDLPAVAGTSRLSPHLAAGELTPRQVLDAIGRAGVGEDVARPFVRQLAWREFAAHVAAEATGLATRAWRTEFERFPWREDPVAFEAWARGRTGFPLVDAGMRELAATGWMHNRVRLVAASLLVKDLLIPWQDGERLFAERLVDFDPASNAFNWQWVAGSGADAAPYFRIFNPSVQAKRFDPHAEYIRRWVPELEDSGYPPPIVDHAEARERALSAYESVKRG